MKKWIRNLALGTLLAVPGAWYTNKEYENYQVPESIGEESLYNGRVTIRTCRSKSNIMFDLFDIARGKYNTETYTTNFAGFQNVKIDVLPVEQKFRKIKRNWEDYVANSKMKKEDW